MFTTKRNLVFLSLFLIFGLMGAAETALAQVVFGVSSNTNNVRVEGLKEAVGQTVLTSSSGGTIIGATAVPPGSSILVTYGAAIANPGSISATNNVSCPVCPAGSIVVTASVNVLTISFANVNVTFVVGNTIVIKGVRINANAFGVGTLNAALSALVPASVSGTNPITFTSPSSVPVAAVQPLATTVALTVGPGSVLTCVPGPVSFSISVTENFNDALTSATDESGLAPGVPGFPITNGSNLLVTLTGVPNTVTITPGPPVFSAPTLTFGATPAAQTAATANATLSFLYTVTATNTVGIESVTLSFFASTASATLPTGLVPSAVTATVSLVSATPGSTTNTPAFAAIPIEGSVTVLSLTDCITNLLFPWVTNFNFAGSTAAGAHFDTGVVIENTTMDPFLTGGATPQMGSCTLTLFPTTGPPVAIPTGPVAPGTAFAFPLSTQPAFVGLSGYLIAECGFQNAHGFAYITNNFGIGNPTSASSYLGLVIPNTSLLPRNPASPATTLPRASQRGVGELLAQ